MINELFAELNNSPKVKGNLIGVILSVSPLVVQTNDIELDEDNLYKTRALFSNDATFKAVVGDKVLLIPVNGGYVVSEVIL